jgi:hypothetical protein
MAATQRRNCEDHRTAHRVAGNDAAELPEGVVGPKLKRMQAGATQAVDDGGQAERSNTEDRRSRLRGYDSAANSLGAFGHGGFYAISAACYQFG